MPKGLGLALLFHKCPLLRAAYLEHHGHFVGAHPPVCFCYGHLPWRFNHHSSFSLMGCPGIRPYYAIQSLRGPFSCTVMTHTKPLLLHSCPSYKGLNAVMLQSVAVALPHYPVIARGTSKPQMHHGCAWHKSQDELICDIDNEHPSS
jgi:hypothetical protein